jgi:pimeloyl-ACP methyl ester carboxylesterase
VSILLGKGQNSTDSKVKRIDGAGHLIHWDKPNEVTTKLVNWFK